MILLWDGKQIQVVDLDKVIPGPRAEEVAALLEPGYLRGYLEGRGHDVGIREIKKKGRLGREYRQIQKLLRKQPSFPPQGAPWQYAMFLKERILEQQATPAPAQKAEPTETSAVDDAQQPEEQPTMPVEEQTEASPVDDMQPPEEQPTMPVEGQIEAPTVDDVQPAELSVDHAQPAEMRVKDAQQPEAEQANTSEVGDAQSSVVPPSLASPSVVLSGVRETAEEPAAQNDGGGGKKRRRRRRKKRRKNCAIANDTCQ